MVKQRPKLKIPLQTFDYFLEILSFAFILFCLTFTFVMWEQLPDRVGTHFNLAGQADNYGSKNELLILLPVLLLLYILLTILARFPHIYNYGVAITENNAERQYRFASRFITILKVEIIIIFTYIQFVTLQSAKSGSFALGIMFLPVILLIMLGTIGIYIALSLKAK